MNKLEHLKMIQDIVSRMAGNSFLTKGWCVTLVAAIIVLGAKEPDKRFILVAFLPIVMFWTLDGYFLLQERLYRKLYDVVRTREGEESDFSMDTSLVNAEENDPVSWTDAVFSKTLTMFYLTMLVAIILTLCLAFKYF